MNRNLKSYIQNNNKSVLFGSVNNSIPDALDLLIVLVKKEYVTPNEILSLIGFEMEAIQQKNIQFLYTFLSSDKTYAVFRNCNDDVRRLSIKSSHRYQVIKLGQINEVNSHVSIGVLDKKNDNMYYFDPGGYENLENYPCLLKLEQVLKKYLPFQNFVIAPNDNIQLHSNDDYCQTWILSFLYECFIEQNYTIDEYVTFLNSLPLGKIKEESSNNNELVLYQRRKNDRLLDPLLLYIENFKIRLIYNKLGGTKDNLRKRKRK